MKIYKPIKFNKRLSAIERDEFALLFSNKSEIVGNENESFFFVRYIPDTYILNKEKIKNFYERNIFVPLVMTNYKFLYLLLRINQEKKYTFTNFELKYEGNEYELEKNTIEEMINDTKPIEPTFEMLQEKGQKIRFIDLELMNSKNRVRIYSNGNIGLSNGFEVENYKEISSIIKLLFTGSLD